MEHIDFPIRINKYLAHMGYATRRSADALIEAGKVFVNGKPATLGHKIQQKDRVEIKDYSTSQYRYLLYYKPRGVITHSPEKGETDIATQIKKDHGITGLFPVGRLDKDSEGLIMLTNDGRITERILNPENGHERTYEVTVDKRVAKIFLSRLAHGVRIENYMTKPARTSPLADEYSFSITLTEGKKHQVRRMCAALGYQVQKLKRVQIMDFKLRSLKSGTYHELTHKETSSLREILGIV